MGYTGKDWYKHLFKTCQATQDGTLRKELEMKKKQPYKETYCTGCGSLLSHPKEVCVNCKSIEKAKQELRKSK